MTATLTLADRATERVGQAAAVGAVQPGRDPSLYVVDDAGDVAPEAGRGEILREQLRGDSGGVDEGARVVTLACKSSIRRKRSVSCRHCRSESFRDGPKDQTRNLEIPGSLRAPE